MAHAVRADYGRHIGQRLPRYPGIVIVHRQHPQESTGALFKRSDHDSISAKLSVVKQLLILLMGTHLYPSAKIS